MSLSFRIPFAMFRSLHTRPVLTDIATAALALVLIGPLVFTPAQALTGGPDAYGYTFTDSTETNGPAFQWIDITTTGQAVVTDGDDSSTFDPSVGNNGPVELGFPFTFYGTTHTSLTAATNGFLSTINDKGDDATNDCPLPARPSEGGGARFYLLHDDLTFVRGGDLYYQYFQKSPHPHAECGVSIFSWNQVIEKSSEKPIDIQALLFDNGDIIYQYGNNNATSNNGYTIAIQDTSAKTALTYNCSNSSLNVPNNLAILITPPSITVTTNADELDATATNGTGISLREAIRDIVDGGQIHFAPSLSGETLDITSGVSAELIAINKPLTINASSLDEPFSISGDRSAPIMNINNATVVLKNLVIRDGVGITNQAAGIEIDTNAAVKLCHVDFLFNRSDSLLTASAIRSVSGGRFSAIKCRFRSNSAIVGAAILTGGSGGGPCVIQHCEFACNRSTDAGGAISFFPTSGVLTITDSSFFDNEVSNGDGGAIRVRADQFLLRNSTLSNNRATGLGGAIRILNPIGSPALVEHCTIAENQSGAASAISVGAPFSIGHTVLTKNYSLNAGNPVIDNLPPPALGTSLGYNLSDVAETLLNQGSDTTNPDPKLGPLGHYGGFTMTHLPLAGSPLIDNGNPAITNPPATDQRKLPRITNGDTPIPSGGSEIIDIGAVESGPFLVVNTVTDENNTPIGAGTGNISLREAVREATSGQHIRFDASLSGAVFTLLASFQGDLVNTNNATSIHIDASNLAIRPVIDGNPNDNIFDMSNGEALSLHHLELVDGRDTSGGAIIGNGPLTLNRCRLAENCSTGGFGGGAIRADGSHHAYHCSEFFENDCTGTGSSGSVAHFTSDTYLRITDCWFHENDHRSGAFNSGRSTIRTRGWVVVDRSTFAQNANPRGHVIEKARDGCFVIRSSTFSGNQSRGSDPVLGTAGFSFPADVSHSTFIGNTAESFLLGSPTVIENSSAISPISLAFNVFSKNFKGVSRSNPANEPLDDSPNRFESRGFNLADVNTPALDHPNDLNVLIPGLDGADLRFGPLAWNGGKVPTHHPLADSPAIDGFDVAVTSSFGLAPVVDVRNVDRSQDGDANSVIAIDCGAVEAVTPIVVNTSNDENTANTTTSLREAITAASDPGRIIFSSSLAGDTIDLDSAAGGQNSQFITTKTLLIDATNLFDGGITVAGPSNSRILNFGTSSATKALSLHGISFTDGKGASGGAIAASNACLTVTHSAFFRNNPSGGGGALLLNNVATLLENVTLSENRAIGGGAAGGAIQASNGTDLTIRHCTIFENEATAAGAGIALIGNTSSAVFYSTILAENRRTNNNLANVFVSGSPPINSSGYNLTDDPATYFTDPTDIVSTNPSLNSLPTPTAYPGGLAITNPPAAGSPAVDNGPAAIMLPPCTDARGFPRSACAAMDIGAYELGAGLGNDFSDGDGIDSYWELFHGLSNTTNDANLDLDGDGMTNLQEFLNGYKPNDPGSVLRTTGLFKPVGQNFANISWIASPGRTYDIYHSEDLNVTDPWNKIGTVTTYTASGEFRIDSSAILNARNAFFEIRPTP
ncbi:MAG: CSLREA domain-containing protein [Verrucomicrobiota bacterium]